MNNPSPQVLPRYARRSGRGIVRGFRGAHVAFLIVLGGSLLGGCAPTQIVFTSDPPDQAIRVKWNPHRPEAPWREARADGSPWIFTFGFLEAPKDFSVTGIDEKLGPPNRVRVRKLDWNDAAQEWQEKVYVQGRESDQGRFTERGEFSGSSNRGQTTEVHLIWDR